MPSRTHLPPVPADALRLIRAVRDARFANGRICPHCRSTHVVVWGGFRGRRRYRCRSCRRTFSDLTGTPYSHSKKPELWPRYQERMRGSWKLRQAAHDVGIHVSTSFRWRHAILSAIPRSDSTPLAGWTEVARFNLPYSEKGTRMRGYGRARRDWLAYSPIHVLVAASRGGGGWSAVAGSGLNSDRLTHLLHPHSKATLLLRAPLASAWQSALRKAGLRYLAVRHWETDDWLHHANVTARLHRLVTWLETFRGVATRYLPNYLAWHRLVDVELTPVWSHRLTVQCSGGTPFS